MKFQVFMHFYFLGPYYVLDDKIGYRKCKHMELGQHPEEVAVITGGHRGMGAWITKDLLSTGMHVIIGCRKTDDGNKYISSLRDKGLTKGKATVLPLDLASLDSVRSFADAVLKETTKINILINNAGIIKPDYSQTMNNFESQWQVNYLGHFLLTHLLLPTLQMTTGNTRVVSITSLVHHAARMIDYKNLNNKDKYDGQLVHATSKLAQIMFTLYLNERLKSIKSNIQMVVAHPGIVNTDIFDDSPLKKIAPFVPRLIFKSPEKGAKPLVYAALYGKGGQYIGNCGPESPSSVSQNKAEQRKLFEESKKSLDITLFGGLF